MSKTDNIRVTLPVAPKLGDAVILREDKPYKIKHGMVKTDCRVIFHKQVDRVLWFKDETGKEYKCNA